MLRSCLVVRLRRGSGLLARLRCGPKLLGGPLLLLIPRFRCRALFHLRLLISRLGGRTLLYLRLLIPRFWRGALLHLRLLIPRLERRALLRRGLLVAGWFLGLRSHLRIRPRLLNLVSRLYRTRFVWLPIAGIRRPWVLLRLTTVRRRASLVLLPLLPICRRLPLI